MLTVRQTLIELLNEGSMNTMELSQKVGIREKEIAAHLSHISRSLQAQGKRLVIRPAVCLLCGYEFKDRSRMTRPGRCPSCKKSHIQSPKFQIGGAWGNDSQ